MMIFALQKNYPLAISLAMLEELVFAQECSVSASFRQLQINLHIVIAMHKPLCYIEFNGSSCST